MTNSESCRLWRRKNPERTRTYQAEYRKLHPGRRRCHKLVELAIRRGELKEGRCVVCGVCNSERIVAHHVDYRRPFEIQWMHLSCHSQHHAKVVDEG